MTLSVPNAVATACERLRRDGSDTMRHDTTSDLSARLMCRVGVADLGLVLAWLDQHLTSPTTPTENDSRMERG